MVRAELTQHLGGKPTAPQRILIDRAAALSLRLHLMDRESTRSGEMTERNGLQDLAWNNSMTRVLNQIGLTAASAPKPQWQPPAVPPPPTAPTAAAMARTERLAQRAAQLETKL